MMTVAARGTRHNNQFDVVAEAFRRKEGLPFADVLTGECIQRVFREENALFGQNDLFSTDIVLWAFLAQTLRDGKSAAVHGKQSRRLGFALACQTVLESWMLLSTGSCSDAGEMYATILAHIAANEVADRPGRIEPRVLKRRRHRCPLMQCPRDEQRAELGKT